MSGHYKSYRFYPIKNPAAKTNNSIYHFAAFAYLRGSFLITVDRQVFQFVGTLDIRISADNYIFNDVAIFNYTAIANGSIITSFFIKFFFRKLDESFFKYLILRIIAP